MTLGFSEFENVKKNYTGPIARTLDIVLKILILQNKQEISVLADIYLLISAISISVNFRIGTSLILLTINLYFVNK